MPAEGGALRQGGRPHLHRRQRCRRARLRSTAARRLRLVSDHAVHLARRSVHEALQEAARRSGDEGEQVRHRAGGGRDRSHRHGAGRGLERRPRLHRHPRPRHFADAGIFRPRLLRRNPGGDFRHPARRAIHRHADAHAAIRYSARRLCEPRRHQAGDDIPEGPNEAFEMAASAFDLPSGCRRRCS